jgi:hypothetical protein
MGRFDHIAAVIDLGDDATVIALVQLIVNARGCAFLDHALRSPLGIVALRESGLFHLAVSNKDADAHTLHACTKSSGISL